MNKEEQKIAIAEACGWEYVEGLDVPSLSYSGATSCADCWVCPKRGAGYGEYEPPNYLTNLNAMHEAEKMLTADQWYEYDRLMPLRDPQKMHATAAQRAEAFLKAIKKWQWMIDDK